MKISIVGLKRVWKKVASQGKVSEKSGNLDIDIEWQPCPLGHGARPKHGCFLIYLADDHVMENEIMMTFVYFYRISGRK